MIFVKAFLLGGLFCLITQLIFRVTKKSVVSVLTFTFCAGVIMTAFGLMDYLTGWGQAGMFLLLYDAGEAAYLGFTNMLNGDVIPIIRYACLILFCFMIGISGGLVLHKKQSRKIQDQGIKR